MQRLKKAGQRLSLAGYVVMTVLSIVLMAASVAYAAPPGPGGPGHGGPGPTNTPEVPLAGILPLGLGVSTWLIYKKRSRSQAK